MSSINDNTYLFGANAVFIEELYKQYIENPQAVDSQWRSYFESLGDKPTDVIKAAGGTSWRPYSKRIIGGKDLEDGIAGKAKSEKLPQGRGAAILDPKTITVNIAASQLIEAYRRNGHLAVQLDPLGLMKPSSHPELDPKSYGLSEADMNQSITLPGQASKTLGELLARLKRTYGSRIGIEYMHIESIEERRWLESKLEQDGGALSLSKEEKLRALDDVMRAEMFENFLHTKFPGTKRFSVEGGEASIAATQSTIYEAAKFGVRDVVLGMAHRGRLNTLTRVMGKTYHSMMSEFKGELAFPENMNIPGDVKYHLGASKDIEVEGNKVHLSLTPNPSHLEAVNAVVLGKVRARQDMHADSAHTSALGLLVHGDAAFAGQGSVFESLALSQLEGYRTGGTAHIIVNNQIGFTAIPTESRSTRYCTDIAKSINAIILHVNGDDIDATIWACKLLAEYRAKFQKDTVLDIVCYRKYGHNEGDEPFFTQPKMYKVISEKENPAIVYSKQLIQEGIITQADFNKMQADFKAFLEQEFNLAQTYKPQKADWLEGNWGNFAPANPERALEKTGVDLKRLQELGIKLSSAPAGIEVNPKILRQLEAKHKMIESGQGLDWGMGEGLAFATLLAEGYNIRITGQDAIRGTFSHRHASLFDQKTEEKFIPLRHLSEKQGNFHIHNSHLSEFGVMGFEYGYSFTDPKALVIWEGQFGDFANGAQVMIDQYVVSGEAKWLRMSGLVLLLPHGYEGQGPEHSSARPERFLQLCADDNIQVANCTTPANLFHILRRQLHRNFRKPLILMTPKSLLRHKLAVSLLEEMREGTTFKPVIGEVDQLQADKVRRVIVCSGKVYYDLYERRQKLQATDVALIRLEEFYPFPKALLATELAKYGKAEVVWCQEEHKNMGGFTFVEPHIEGVLAEIGHSSKRAKYVGRSESASPAVGYAKLHAKELEELMKDAFNK
jgi:2-oxoglutarate dehydrogenase E1 component